MAHEARSIYEQLTGVKVDDVTIEQLDFTRNTFIDKESVEYWKGVITISKILEASRTYPWGLPIPGSSEVVTINIDPLGEGYIQPTGTEVWEILNIRAAGIGGSATATISWADGATDSEFNVGASIPAAGTNVDLNASISGPRRVTTTGYIKVRETGGAVAIQLIVAYHKLSL